MNNSEEYTVTLLSAGGDLKGDLGPVYIQFSYEDPVTGARGDALMIFEHDSDRVATWRLRPKEGVYPITEKSKRPPRTFSIPRDMVLRKVE